MVTNDNTHLESRTSFDEPLLAFDFPGMQIGVAEYEAGPTGCTVFYWDGDTLFAVPTNEVKNPGLDEVSLAVAASETVWDAVLSISEEGS